MNPLRILLPALPLLIAGACSSDECLENRNALPLAGFYSSASGREIALDSISIYGIEAPGDSILLDSARNVSETFLPFRIDAETTSYVVKYLQRGLDTDRLNDTITFRYRTNATFTDAACGASFRFDIKAIDATTHLIDSVTCPAGFIDNKNIQNLRIYFRTAAPEEPEQ